MPDTVEDVRQKSNNQNPTPKCTPKVTALVDGPLVGRLKRTGNTASPK
jgi:hypothetical protein